MILFYNDFLNHYNFEKYSYQELKITYHCIIDFKWIKFAF